MQKSQNLNASPFASEPMTSTKNMFLYRIYTMDVKRQTHRMRETIIQGYKLL